MERVVTSSEMQDIDRFAVHSLRIPSRVLMEHAGFRVVEAMEKCFGTLLGKTAIVFCGKGNNGGDGYVAARILVHKGMNVKVLSFGQPSKLSNDSKACLHTLKNYSKRKGTLGGNPVSFISISGLKRTPKPDFIVDAIFGIGLSKPVRGKYQEAVNWINKSGSKVISVDISSGIDADSGVILGTAVKSDLTVTFQYKKRGVIINDGRSYAGNVTVADISIPEVDSKIRKTGAVLVEASDVRRVLPRRPMNSHKYSVGKVLVVAGSRGMTGAAAMTAQSAMRSGAGVVKLICPKSIAPVLSKKLTEVMVIPVEETATGSLCGRSLPTAESLLTWADVVVVGPGLSQHHETSDFIRLLVDACNNKLLLDADGINAFTGNYRRLSRYKGTGLIMTPHTGELSHLMSVPSSEIEKKRIDTVRLISQRLNATVILKGAPTVIGNSKGRVFINSTGNAGMATAGAGDVLSGIIAGLWSQKMDDNEVAYASVYLHGLSGDLALKKYGEKSLMALDILDQLPFAIKQVESGQRVLSV